MFPDQAQSQTEVVVIARLHSFTAPTWLSTGLRMIPVIVLITNDEYTGAWKTTLLLAFRFGF